MNMIQRPAYQRRRPCLSALLLVVHVVTLMMGLDNLDTLSGEERSARISAFWNDHLLARKMIK